MADHHDNLVLTAAYQKIVEAGDSFLLTLPRNQGCIEVVPWSGQSPPAASLVGHVLGPDKREGLNRDLSGPGAIYARAPSGAVLVALTHWTPE